MSRLTKQTKLVALVALFALATGCGGDEGIVGPRDVELESVLADPEGHDGERLRFRAFYVGSFELSVLTAALAESYPPQPAEPTIWVDASPRGGCIVTDVGVTWGEVVAEGVFRYDEGGGFGHLGIYRMQLEGARLACP
ncbi:MAG TPA: hypothetical protein VF058_04975 [Actinomycetota bacterium]